MEHHGGSLCWDRALMLIELKNSDDGKLLEGLKVDGLTELENRVRNKALAIALVKHSGRVRYSTLLDSVENQFSLGIDQYPSDMASALAILDCYIKPPTSRHHLPDNDNVYNIDMTFVQDGNGEYTPGTDSITHDSVTCYGYQVAGNYRDKCTSSSGTLSPHMQLLQINEDDEPNIGGDGDDDSGVSIASSVHVTKAKTLP